MFNPHDTESMLSFLGRHASDVQQHGSSATGAKRLLDRVDQRVQRRRDSKQLLRLTADQLRDSGWTRHDVVGSKTRWSKLLKHHGATALVRTLRLTLSDATELGMTSAQLLGMSSDLHALWGVTAPDMIALGATVPQLLDRYETASNLSDMGFTRSVMVQMGMKADKANEMFGNMLAVAGSAPAVPEVTDREQQLGSVLAETSARLESVSIDNSTSFDF